MLKRKKERLKVKSIKHRMKSSKVRKRKYEKNVHGRIEIHPGRIRFRNGEWGKREV